jgi:predicted nucleotidyltransferase
MQLIHKVVVGSRLHGLNNEKSDFDYRGVFMHDMIDVLSPFRSIKNTTWIEGEEDNTAYELRDFCKYLTQGNATILEVLYSNQVIETSDLGKELVDNRLKFLDSTRIYEAHKGYAHNQYNKMNLFEPDARTPKFAIAYLRSLVQCKALLETGELSPQYVEDDKDFLMAVKYNFKLDMVQELSRKFAALQVSCADAYAKNHNKFKPDIPWIEDFVLRAYIK